MTVKTTLQESDFVKFMSVQQDGVAVEEKEDFWEVIPHSGLLYKLTSKLN